MAIEIASKVKKATVTFTTQAREDASQAFINGEWNDWKDCVMKKNNDGTFSAKVNLDLGKSYQFGYSIDGVWTPDPGLPLAASPFGTNNSILDLTEIVAAKSAAKNTAKRTVRKSAPKKKR
jgi:1,4-alpha-glucan branching enzyme